MKIRRVAIILFYDDKENILFQNRKSISKHGEEYGFFEGHFKKNKNPKQTLKREIKKELEIKLKDLKKLKFFKHFIFKIKEWDEEIHRFVFIAKIPDLTKLKVHKGKAEIIKFKDSFDLKLVPGDEKILKEIYKSLKTK